MFIVEVGRSDSEATVTTVNTTQLVLDELKRWTEYKIWVLAGTSVGDGPKSFPVKIRTLEDGMYLFKVTSLILPIFFCFFAKKKILK